MTTEQYATARATATGIKPSYFAYYAGRNDAANGIKPEFISDAEMRDSYQRGFRSMRSEMRLDADTEWDSIP
jgi:hypothetical protein